MRNSSQELKEEHRTCSEVGLESQAFRISEA